MSHKKKYAAPKPKNAAERTNQVPQQQSAKGVEKKPTNYLKIVFFLIFLVFCTFFYGDVFVRAQQEAFVCPDASAMNVMLRSTFGHLAWAGRYMLVVYKSVWVGGLVMALLLMVISCLVERVFKLKGQWRGLSFAPSLLILFCFVYRGLNIFYQSEPAWIMLIPVLTMLVLLLLRLVQIVFDKKKEAAANEGAAASALPLTKQWGTLASLALSVGLYLFAWFYQQNAIIASQQQLAYQEQDWDTLMEKAMSARRPTRIIAAYNAIGALRTDQLIEQMFAIPYDYPNPHLRSGKISEEYPLLQADCDLETGLVQVAYHYSLEYIVLSGPSTYNLKNLAICSILQGDKELAKKYLTILSKVPFEGRFVERYSAMLENPKLIDEDAHLAAIKQLTPRENKFEQQYRQPAFLGYNLGLNSAPDNAIYTTVAACLYSKDLLQLVPRLGIMKQKGIQFSSIILQAICCMSIKNPDILKQFPEAQMEMNNFQQFLTESKPYVKDKDQLRKVLKEDWLGTYYYYYYAENNSPEQTGGDSKSSSGVN